MFAKGEGGRCLATSLLSVGAAKFDARSWGKAHQGKSDVQMVQVADLNMINRTSAARLTLHPACKGSA